MKKALFVVGLLLLLIVPAGAQSSRQVWAFYMGFWVGEASWGMQNDVLTDRPAIGNYDSRDPGVMGLQIDQAKNAGIDAFLVSWFGLEDQGTTTPVLLNALDRANERGFKIGVAVDLFVADFNNNVGSLTNSLSWVINGIANHPAYLRVDGKPVIAFVFQGNLGLNNNQWVELRNQLDPGRNTIWLGEGINGCCLYGGAMDGMYAFNLSWANGSSGRYSSERNNVLRRGGTLYVPMVHPGWDETLIARREGRRNPTSPRARANGRFLTTSFNGAVASGANIIMIGTWNEFVENSHIEPSVNFGNQSLDTLAPLIARWKGTPAPASTGGGGGGSVATRPESPTGLIMQSTQRVNVRPSAGTSGSPLGQISPGTYYAVLSQEGEWVKIDFNGREGFVSARFATIEQR